MGGGKAGVFGRQGPSHPHLANFATRAALPPVQWLVSRRGLVGVESASGREQLGGLQERIRSGREAYLVGVGFGMHNSGAALVRVSASGAVELICNEEEERYTGVKHSSAYPERAIEAVRARMAEMSLGPADLAACVSCWDYAQAMVTFVCRPIMEEVPATLSPRLKEHSDQVMDDEIAKMIWTSAKRLRRQLGVDGRTPIVGMRHHDSHAYFSYASSPFAAEPEPTMVLVLDGSGDDASTSLYEARDAQLDAAAQGRNFSRLPRHALRDAQLDPGRLADAQLRGPLYGCRRLGRWKPAHQPLLPPPAADRLFRAQRRSAPQPGPRQLAAADLGRAVQRGAAGHPRRPDRGRGDVESGHGPQRRGRAAPGGHAGARR